MKPQDLSPYLKPGNYQMPRRLFNDSGDYQTFRAKGKRYKNHRRGGLKTARDQRHPTQETDERAT